LEKGDLLFFICVVGHLHYTVYSRWLSIFHV